MAYNEKLADRIRNALAHLPNVEEKKMFRGVTFMVDGKMCVNVSGDDLMCRFDPALQDNVAQRKGYRTMLMRGREYQGYCYVGPEGITTEEDFAYWIGLSLDYNKHAKASKRRKK